MTLKTSLMTVAAAAATSLMFAATASPAWAAKCSNDGAAYGAWLEQFSQEAAASGIGKRGLAALANTRYSKATISADRNQKSFKLSLDQFMKVRGGATIISKGKSLRKSNAGLFDAIEKRYGVPAGPLLAIWGMETGFGGFMGNENVLSATATLSYDCRRSEFFTGHLLALLQLIDQGVVSPDAKGAKHGELGHTQFLPGNVLRYGVDGDGNGSVNMNSKADALASTANFLKGHGWSRGGGYQPGEGNFGAIQGWNAAGVYQKAIAIIAAEIDG
ncbi:MAG: lytic murein transglycosylase [Phyllobacteriaceae bacterium]|nr:lytic murein transglycosylase [Phyllobacteriaceae bacterium]